MNSYPTGNPRVCSDQVMDTSSNSGKRQRRDNHVEDYSQPDNPTIPCHSGRRFLPIRKGDAIYCTEEWKSTGTSLFHPVTQDLFVNLVKYEQFSVSEGNFFVADKMGNYTRSVTGKVVHMWRYDKVKRKLFIAQSFLFTCPQDFTVIQAVLHSL